MPVSTAPPVAARGRASLFSSQGIGVPLAARVPVAIESIGYLVPRAPFSGRIHSVFARACNIEWGDRLLTLCTGQGAQGPGVLRIASGGPADMRALLHEGSAYEGDRDRLRSGRAEFLLSHSAVWRPPVRRPLQPPSRIKANVDRGREQVAAARTSMESIVESNGAAVVGQLVDACRLLDTEAAARHVHRLVGWGEGLTPAGDDVLVGLLAALDADALDDQVRRRFRDALRAACLACSPRTTRISAEQMRLAAEGHHAEPTLRARDAVLGEDDPRVVEAAITAALAIGATSGAATMTGLLAGIESWLPVAASARARP